MSAAVLIETFASEGISLSLHDGRILAKPKERITPNHLKTLRDHKAALVEYLRTPETAPVEDELKNVVTDSPVPEPVAPPAQPYRSFLYPDGRRLDLSKDEFDSVVEVFRMLNNQYERQGGLPKEIVASEEKEMFEPEADRNSASCEVKDARNE